MDKLYTFYYSLSVPDRAVYATNCRTTVGYLQKALYLWKTKNKMPRFDGELCLLLSINSNGAVLKQELRPDIWPELVAA